MSRSEGATPAVSVVVACVGDAVGATRCLEALVPQVENGEILLCTPSPVSTALSEQFPDVAVHERSGALVPQLWRDGIDHSRGEVVALTISPMVPAEDWIETAWTQAQRYGAVAGSIEPLDGLPLSDLAECMCRYARDLPPFEPHEDQDIPGDNCAYLREHLIATRSLWADGFWEPVVNSALAGQGVALWHDPELRVRQGRAAGPVAFLRQRRVHGRAHGRQRGERFGRLRNLVGVLAAPAVPFVLLIRTYRALVVRGRLTPRTLAIVPWLVAFNSAWAAGEARGHLDALRGP